MRSILRQPCRYFLKGTCTRTSCEHWHPPECQLYKNETGCKAGDRCVFLHYKVDEQPKKRPKKSYFPKRRECDDKYAEAVVKSVSQLGSVSWSMNVVLQSHGETLRLRIETLPSHLMNFQWSREQKWNRVRVGMVYSRTVRRTQIAMSACRRK